MRGFHRDGERDLVFVPLGINYDRVLEDRSLLQSLEGRKHSRWSAARNTLAFVWRNLMLLARSSPARSAGRRQRSSAARSCGRWRAC